MTEPTTKEITNIKLTQKDHLLLELLQKNARESNASLARKIGVSRATIQERINRLEKAEIIQGYTAKINHEKLHKNLKAIVMVMAENKALKETFLELEKMPYIQTVHSLSGEWDWSMFVSAPSLDDFHQCVTDINKLAGVKSTVSHIIMKTRLDRKRDVLAGY